MKNLLYEKALEAVLRGIDVIAVQVMKVYDSAPAKAGDLIIICKDFRTYGTIGGGGLEKFVCDTAFDMVYTDGKYRTVFDLSNGQMDMICGGKVELEYTLLRDKKDVTEFFKDEITAPRCVIFGGGHVGREVCRIASYAGFDVVLLDNRKEFATSEIHPDAKQCILCDYDRISESIEIEDEDYIVIMTHGHLHDASVLLQVCSANPKYIGCIGSRKKVEATREFLRANGVEESKIKSVCSPIGLPIGGNSPEEIAISVVSQLIQYRYLEEK